MKHHMYSAYLSKYGVVLVGPIQGKGGGGGKVKIFCIFYKERVNLVASLLCNPNPPPKLSVFTALCYIKLFIIKYDINFAVVYILNENSFFTQALCTDYSLCL